MFLFLRGDRSAETWQIFQELDWTLGWRETSSVRERERGELYYVFSQPECQSVQYEGVRAVRALCSSQSAGPLGAVS